MDIRRDGLSIEKVPTYISLDIDSLIWKTNHLNVKGMIHIHMVPYMQKKPPIDIHNKTYVKLLQPQTDIQHDNHEYTTYERFPLKNIPHIHFGYLEGGVNVWVAWPRMTHRQQDSPYYANLVPMLVQDRWFSLVIQPCIQKIYGRGSQEYVSHSTQEYKSCAAGKKETRLLDHIKLQYLQDEIKMKSSNVFKKMMLKILIYLVHSSS